ncbi:MAG: fibrobacter succinogenes major paralogous domain-containing protein [Bacteroidales bacterium]|jgi:uncharacterized protein (TIGR02145 family)|nr:fibrobacter succinogenes major paralogous domain-containing protein [Bacteroidales bacterium]
MKKLPLILAVIITCCWACKNNEVPEGYIEYQDSYYRNPVPVQYDSNGDGNIDASDAYIEVLGNNLLVSETPQGGSLYKGENNEAGGVANGERFCYQNADRNCDKYGALYSMETALNGSWETLKQASSAQLNDKNLNGVWDYLDEIAVPNSQYINALSASIASQAAKEFVTLLTEATQIAPAPVVQSLMSAQIYDVIVDVLQKVLAANTTYIDVTNIQEEIDMAIEAIIIDAAIEHEWETNSQLDAIATSVAKNASNALSQKISEDALKQIQSETIATANSVQGLCPNGYHIPSDADWMLFEMALGMTATDAMKSGIEVVNRGAAAKVVEKMVDTHGFVYGGYITENGNFTQLDGAGVFVSSTVGSDEQGNYMWVRQIDKSYTGVVRYKHYAPSGLSIRCFKN